MITCTNCKSELFKAEKLLTETHGVIVVRLTCAKCGHRLQVWIENAEIKEMRKEIKEYNEKLDALNGMFQGFLVRKDIPWWKKLFR